MELTLDKNSISKELLFILDLICDKKSDSYEEVDWEEFLIHTQHHRVYPLLYSKVKQLEHMIPDFVRQSLYSDYKHNIFQMLRLRAEMSGIHELFFEVQIQTLFLKGPILAEELYGDLSLRTCSDIDLLIPLNQLEYAESLLINLGYEKDDYIETVLNDWRWRHHHVTYYHPIKKIKVEVHWRMHPGPGKEPTFDVLWERRRVDKITGTAVYYLGREDLFLFLTAHGARHGWSRLRWLTDMYYLSEQDLDWSLLYKLFQVYSSPHLCGQVLILLSHLLDMKLREEMNPFISRKALRLAQEALFYLENRVQLHTKPLAIEVANYHKRYLVRLMSFKQLSLFALSTLHPFPEDAQTLPLPVRLHFLYFPLRPFLWIWRKSRKVAVT